MTAKNYLALSLMLLLASCDSNNGNMNEQAATTVDTSTASSVDTTAVQMPKQTQVDVQDKKILAKIKAKTKRNYPDDYISQLGVYNMQVESYNYMKTVPDLVIKKKVQRDYPLDFISQKGVYNMEVDAKEQMK